MFGVIQWDSPWALLAEFLLAVAVFIVLFIIARRIERRDRDARADDLGSLPLASMQDEPRASSAPPVESRGHKGDK